MWHSGLENTNELSEITWVRSGQTRFWTHIFTISMIGLFPLAQAVLSVVGFSGRKGAGVVFWLPWLSASKEIKFLPRRNQHFLLAAGTKGRSHIICHYCLLVGTSSVAQRTSPQLRAQITSPRPFSGLPASCTVAATKGWKPHNYFYLFENRSDHICLPC